MGRILRVEFLLLPLSRCSVVNNQSAGLMDRWIGQSINQSSPFQYRLAVQSINPNSMDGLVGSMTLVMSEYSRFACDSRTAAPPHRRRNGNAQPIQTPASQTFPDDRCKILGFLSGFRQYAQVRIARFTSYRTQCMRRIPIPEKPYVIHYRDYHILLFLGTQEE